jgi:hypothetical protein
MKKTLLLYGALALLSNASIGQTTIFLEDFEGGTNDFTLNSTMMSSTNSGYNEWVVNDIYTGGSGSITCFTTTVPYTIPVTAPQPAGISSQNGKYAHILSDDLVTAGIYNAGFRPADGVCTQTENYFMVMTNPINTSAFTGVNIDFWWLANGGADNYGELYYSVDGGSTWTQETTTMTYTGEVLWANETITNAAWDSQASLMFGFRFVNGVPGGTPSYFPSFSIDDFEVIGTPGACSNSTSNFSETACFSYTVPSGDETYTAGGTYTVMDTILNVTGCDSIMTISVTVDTLNLDVTDDLLANSSLTSDYTGGTYQWLSGCDTGTGSAISGEAGQSIDLTTLGDGYYSVIVTDNGCSDTSNCVQVVFFGLEQITHNEFALFPNPTSGSFSIQLEKVNSQVQLQIIDLNGKVVLSESFFNTQTISDIYFNGEAGIYMITLTDESGLVKRSQLILE